jgi:hypothetical protein
MNVDWSLAIGIFVMFTAWSLVYYTGFFESPHDASQGMDSITGRMLDFLGTDESGIPVLYDSPSAGPGVLYADLVIPEEDRTGLRVLSGSSETSCMLSGDRLYWESDLVPGTNSFTISYSDIDSGGCQDTFDTSGANQTFPLASVRSVKVSSSTLSALQGVPYENFRNSLAIRNQARIEWSGALTGSYGPEPPGNRDVIVRETTRPHLESLGTLTIRVLVWE